MMLLGLKIVDNMVQLAPATLPPPFPQAWRKIIKTITFLHSCIWVLGRIRILLWS